MIFMAAAICAPAARAFQTPAEYPSGSQCVVCHQNVEWIRDPSSEMMRRIMTIGRDSGDPAGCVVCHGGDPQATTAEAAHAGKSFYPDPSSPWINANTCGQCHERHVSTQWTSLMMTEAGKIQGTAWAFGGLEGYEHKWGNYDVTNPEDPHARIGTDVYRAYMEALSKKEPQVFPNALTQLPAAPTDMDRLASNPQEAAFTYIRDQCNRCHWAVQGRQVRGDYRGMGCSACHLPYGVEGFYEGADESIPKDKPGHPLVHSIQATREAKVTINDHTYSGIPVETCAVCHNRGKRIGVSYQGLMESAYSSPYTEGGGGQLPLHTKHYISLQDDVHNQKGMLCQDCHTSNDVHSDGFLACTNLAAVEIECSDCHGTPEAYPWELPIGYMDEYDDHPPITGPPRGTAASLYPPLDQGTVHPAQDGYLLTARGNPLPGSVRRGNSVIVHTAAGKDIELKPLKLLMEEERLSKEAKLAMHGVSKHMQKMECYSCHATWTPQCYGCHVKIDYSGGKTGFDWTAAGHRHGQCDRNGAGETQYELPIPGETTEERSFLRWEDPALGVNGEGRVTPIVPGCQVAVTVVGEDGKDIIRNKIFRAEPFAEGAGAEGPIGVDTSPTQPHTIQKRARTCESCHLSDKALGYGIDGGRLTKPWDEAHYVDLTTADGHVLSKNARPQIEPIEGLVGDWSRVVTEDGQQIQTVGHHFKRDRPLNNEERANMSRQGLCVSCHTEIPEGSLAVSALHHAGEFVGLLPKNAEAHSTLVHKSILTAAWAQVLAPVALLTAGIVVIARLRRRRRLRTAASEIKEG
ncbi:MAG: hypothetical protein AMXMBFR20_34460 [Planctomycetia bacterium]